MTRIHFFIFFLGALAAPNYGALLRRLIPANPAFPNFCVDTSRGLFVGAGQSTQLFTTCGRVECSREGNGYLLTEATCGVVSYPKPPRGKCLVPAAPDGTYPACCGKVLVDCIGFGVGISQKGPGFSSQASAFVGFTGRKS